MTPASCPAVALIIDPDLGFLMWLGDVFTALGWQAIPALHCRHALTLAKRMNLPIRTLLIDPQLPGAQGVLRQIAAANPGVRIVLIRDSQRGPERAPTELNFPPPPCYAVLERPLPMQTVSRSQWVRKVQDLLDLLSRPPLY